MWMGWRLHSSLPLLTRTRRLSKARRPSLRLNKLGKLDKQDMLDLLDLLDLLNRLDTQLSAIASFRAANRLMLL
jgi:hypothetical protein